MKTIKFFLAGFISLIATVVYAADECLNAAELVQKGAAMGDGSKQEEGIYRQAINKCSGLVEAYYNLGVVLLKNNRVDEAGRTFDKAISLNKTPLFMIAKADVLIKQGKMDEAFNLYNEILEIDPKNDRAYQGLAAIYAKKSDFLGAESALRQGMQYNADEPALYYNLGIVLSKLNREDEAVVSLETAVEKNPRMLNAQIELSQAYIRLKRYIDAERLLLGLSKKENTTYHIYDLLSVVYIESNRLDLAKTTLEAALKKWPEYSNLYLNYSLTLGLLNEDDEAMNFAKKAAEIAPKSAPAYALIGWLYLKKRKTVEAKSELMKAVSFDDRHVDALNNLGVVFELEGDKKQAQYYYSRVIEVNPKHVQAQEGLQRLGN